MYILYWFIYFLHLLLDSKPLRGSAKSSFSHIQKTESSDLSLSARRRSVRVEELSRTFENAPSSAASSPEPPTAASRLRRAKTSTSFTTSANTSRSAIARIEVPKMSQEQRRPSQELHDFAGSKVFATPALSFVGRPDTRPHAPLISSAVAAPAPSVLAVSSSSDIDSSSASSKPANVSSSPTLHKKEKKEKKEKKDKDKSSRSRARHSLLPGQVLKPLDAQVFICQICFYKSNYHGWSS